MGNSNSLERAWLLLIKLPVSGLTLTTQAATTYILTKVWASISPVLDWCIG